MKTYGILLYLICGQCEVGEYGNNTWTKTLTLSQLDSLLSAKGENIGSAQDIVITKISTGGRVQEMKIVGTSGSVTLTKENIRTYFSGAAAVCPVRCSRSTEKAAILLPAVDLCSVRQPRAAVQVL